MLALVAKFSRLSVKAKRRPDSLSHNSLAAAKHEQSHLSKKLGFR